jgi:hypothetical protein
MSTTLAITIFCSGNAPIQIDPDGPGPLKLADFTAAAAAWSFTIEQLDDGWASVKSLLDGSYWYVGPDKVLANRPAEPAELQSAEGRQRFGFRFESATNGQFYLRSGQGMEIVLDNNGRFIAQAGTGGALVDMATQDVDADDFLADRCSCHPPGDDAHGEGGHERAVRWEDAQHRRLVENALAILGAQKFASLEGRQRVLKLFDNQDFRSAVFKGLHDADYKFPYNDGIAFFVSHFYDPDTRKNFLGLKSPTALASFVKYQLKSRSVLDYIDEQVKDSPSGRNFAEHVKDAGYNLGLAMHFLTDLSQPMHAANFINFPPDWRHSGFEKLADRIGARWNLAADAVDGKEIDLVALQFSKEEDVAHALALKSKQIFKRWVSPLMERHVVRKAAPRGYVFIYNNEFTEEECGGIFAEALRNGQIAAVQALLLFGKKLPTSTSMPAGTIVRRDCWSNRDPALAFFSGSRHLFWANDDCSIYHSCSDDGVVWREGQLTDAGNATTFRPAAVDYAGRLYLFWHTNDGSKRLHVSSVKASGDDIDNMRWEKGVALRPDIKAKGGPGVVRHNGVLHLFWIADDGSNAIEHSEMRSADMIMGAWSAPRPIDGDARSPSAPAGCSVGEWMYLFWRANDSSKRIYWSRSRDARSWEAAKAINDHDSSSGGLSAAEIDGIPTVYWRANDDSGALYQSGATDGLNWPRGTVINPNISAAGAPTMVGYYRRLLCWRETGRLGAIMYAEAP